MSNKDFKEFCIEAGQVLLSEEKQAEEIEDQKQEEAKLKILDDFLDGMGRGRGATRSSILLDGVKLVVLNTNDNPNDPYPRYVVTTPIKCGQCQKEIENRIVTSAAEVGKALIESESVRCGGCASIAAFRR